MKHFTRDLLRRYGSKNDDIADEAADEFERVSARYSEYLAAIRKKLPVGFVQLQERFSLHDARLAVQLPLSPFDFAATDIPPLPRPSIIATPLDPTEDAGQTRSFLLVVRLDAPPGELLVLHYCCASVQSLTQSTVSETSRYYDWLCDEVELVAGEEGPEFIHSILFTNGLEVEIRFTDFSFALLTLNQEAALT